MTATAKPSLFFRAARHIKWRFDQQVVAPIMGNIVHPLREPWYRRPDRRYSGELAKTTSQGVAQALETLRRDGIVALPGYYSGDRLGQLQCGFAQMYDKLASIQHLADDRKDKYRDPGTNTTYTLDPFRYHPSFLTAALDEFLLSVVERYFGKRVMLCEAVAHRYYPMEPKDFSSWMWHHDGLGKRINVMTLLTDVTDRDQYMIYLRGSQPLFHRFGHWYRPDKTRFTEDDLRRLPPFERMVCTAAAGTVFMFDSNGLHRGTRSLGAHRDALICCYAPWRAVCDFDVPGEAAQQLTEKQRAFLLRNPRVKISGAARP
jgi:hypothetical protein